MTQQFKTITTVQAFCDGTFWLKYVKFIIGIVFEFNWKKSMQQMILLTLLILFGTTANWAPAAQTESLPAVKDFKVEAKESQTKQAPIMVLFMSNTCTYCEKVLQDYLLPMQRDHEYDNKVILRQIEINSQDKLIDFNGKVTTQSAYSSTHKIWAVPTIMLFDSQGHELTQIVGLLTLDFYLAYLDNAINESQAKIKAQAK
jgi:thioredoxin-related protein